AEPRRRRLGIPELVRIEAGPRADAAGAGAAVAEVNRDGVVGVARHDPGRGLDGAAAISQLDHVHDGLAVLAAVGSRFAAGRALGQRAEAEALGRDRTQASSVVPGEARDRLGQFLEPTVIGEATVE